MAELFKFRCYQCEKLIGAPPSRFGSNVKCPRCGVDLVVPSPGDEEEPANSPDPDVFRPEDLGLNLDPEPLTRPPQPSRAPEPVGPDPIAFLSRVAEAEPEVEGEESGPPPEEELDLPEPCVEPLVPRRKPGRAAASPVASPRARDVVLPRTAVVAWALFAILALGLAFVAGLFTGQRMGR